MAKLTGRTYGETLGPAMAITDQAEADDYFRQLVEHHLREAPGTPRAEAERVQRINLGYFAGYHGPDVRERVERLFRCSHPVFGSIAENGSPTAEQSLAAGRALVENHTGDAP